MKPGFFAHAALCCTASLVPAMQAAGPQLGAGLSPTTLDQLIETANAQKVQAHFNDADKKAALSQDLLLKEKMNRFANAWNTFIEEYSKGSVNVKKAKALHHAWQQLERELPK